MTDPNQNPSSGPPDERPAERLSADEAAQLAGRIGELAQSRLPLADGLRAAAAETSSRRLSRAMTDVAAALERGQSLDAALAAGRGRFPPYLQALVAAATRSGRLGETLEQFAQFRSFAADLRRDVWRVIAYPLLLLAVAGGLFVFMTRYVVEPAARTLRTYDPDAHAGGLFWVMVWIARHQRACAIGSLAIIAALALCCLVVGPARRRRLLNRLPLFGAVWRYGGLARFSQLLGLLVKHSVPLPEALRLTAAGIGDADLAAGCRELAGRVEAGEPLSSEIARAPQFTPLLPALLQWGEAHSALPAALEAGAQMSARRVELRVEMLRWIVPPAALLAVLAIATAAASIQLTIISSLSSPRYFRYMFGQRPPPDNSEKIAIALVIAGIVAIHAAAFVWARYRNLLSPRTESWWAAVHVLAVAVLVIAVVGAGALFIASLGTEIGVIAVVLWGMAAFRLRQSQRAALTDLLAHAVRRGMPLEPLVRAFSAEQPGSIGRGAARLADWLAAGWGLADALRVENPLLSPRALLAADVGEQSGALAATLPQARESGAASVRVWGGATIGVASLWYLAAIGLFVGAFTMIWVMPQIFIIMRGYHVQPPEVTQRFDAFFHSPAVEIVLIVVGVAIVLATLYIALYLMGMQRFGMPLVGRLLRPLDAAVVLRCLSIPAGRGQPIEPMLRSLMFKYPKALIRRRLFHVARAVDRGGDWIAALRAQRLIRAADAAILRAAAPAGNLGWALSEAAASGERLVGYRLQAVQQILLPLLIVVAGAFVLMFCLAVFLPLVDLIKALAR